MRPSENTLDALADIAKVETSGQIRRIGAQMLLALARKEISATDLEAAAKMVAAQAMHMGNEMKMHLHAQTLREKGAALGAMPELGLLRIGEPK